MPFEDPSGEPPSLHDIAMGKNTMSLQILIFGIMAFQTNYIPAVWRRSEEILFNDFDDTCGFFRVMQRSNK